MIEEYRVMLLSEIDKDFNPVALRGAITSSWEGVGFEPVIVSKLGQCEEGLMLNPVVYKCKTFEDAARLITMAFLSTSPSAGMISNAIELAMRGNDSAKKCFENNMREVKTGEVDNG